MAHHQRKQSPTEVRSHILASTAISSQHLSSKDTGEAYQDVPDQEHPISPTIGISDTSIIQTPRKPKNFVDLPGEIRNAIYRAICELVTMSSMTYYTASMMEYKISIEEYYSVSRPFAMLRTNRQLQDEFFNILFPSNLPVHSGLPFGHMFMQTHTRVNCATSQRDGTFDIPVNARFDHELENYLWVSLAFEDIPEVFHFTAQSYEAIEKTWGNFFDSEEKFSVLQFLIGVDQVLSLDLNLEGDEVAGDEDGDNDLEQEGWKTGSLVDESVQTVIFELVMKWGDDGVVEISVNNYTLDD